MVEEPENSTKSKGKALDEVGVFDGVSINNYRARVH